MKKQYISDKSYDQIGRLPDAILMELATVARDEWIGHPADISKAAAVYVFAEHLEARGLRLPEYSEPSIDGRSKHFLP